METIENVTLHKCDHCGKKNKDLIIDCACIIQFKKHFLDILTSRVLTIQSEPNGIVRETMINNLLIGINFD